MASLSLYPQSETSLMSNRKVIELLLQLKSAKAHGKNCKKVEAHLVRNLKSNRLYKEIHTCWRQQRLSNNSSLLLPSTRINFCGLCNVWVLLPKG